MSAGAVDDVAPFERSREDQGWARWLARSLDALLISPFIFIFFFALGLAVEFGRLPPEFVTWADNPIAAAIVEVVAFFAFMLLWEPLFLSNTGTTPGKWLMGVRVRRADGRKVGLFAAYLRFVWAWAVGLGLGIPLVSLICMLIARSKLISDGATAWDEGLKLQVTHAKRHPIVWALVIVCVAGLTIAFRVLNRMQT